MNNAPPSDNLPPVPIPNSELRMSFFDHLNELRRRLTWAFLSLLLGTVLGFFFSEAVLRYLVAPYAERLVVLGPTGSVVTFFRVSLMLGGIFAFPMILYQILLFVLPGLHRNEKRILIFSLPPVMVLFIGGIAFAWFILVPPAIGFLAGFQTDIFRPEWTADQYIGFITALLFWMGVAFEMPLVMFVLAILGFVRARGLLRQWRLAVVLSAVAAAFITPTVDPVNMMLVMGPLLMLYVISIFLVMIGARINTPKETTP
ncbi:MAG: twin-arginine translocase subunit TatC [Anaerolineae bacterium]|nr:twin-arginine translocase subunit TatC [Anaerolineae bacterium]